MARFLLVAGLAALAVIVVVAKPRNLDQHEQWTQFKNTFNKEYATQAEEQERFEIFKANLRYIELHNADGLHKFRLAVNQFSDKTHTELRGLNGYRQQHKPSQRVGKVHQPKSKVSLPSSVDWRNQGLVTPVKDQGQCGSCWAFSTVASLEGQHAKATGQLVSLSEQDLVDCSNSNSGCNGGSMESAFLDIKDAGGIDTESSYPYEAQDDYCRFNSNNVGATDTGYVRINQGDEQGLMDAVANVGPISVAIDASQSSFNYYQGGIYSDPNCSQTNLDHGVTVVGYGSENGQDYWLVKNSWGQNWGEQGYIRMARGQNMCGIATDASYPTV